MKKKLCLLIVWSLMCVAPNAFGAAADIAAPAKFEVYPQGYTDAIYYSAFNVFQVEETVTIRNADGETIPGTVSDVSDVFELRVFVPTDPMPVGAYEFEINHEWVGDSISDVKVIERPESPSFEFDATPVWHERWVDSVCCEAGGCGSLSSGGCYMSCWASEFYYTPGFNLDITTNAPMRITIRSEADSAISGTQVTPASGQLDATAETYAHGAVEEFCATIIATDLDNNEEIQTETHCVKTSEYPEVEEREPDFPNEVEECTSPPDDKNDPNWVKYGKGCSSTDAGSSPLILLLAMMFGAVRRRRSARDKA